MLRRIEGRNIVDGDQDRRDFVRRLAEVAGTSGTTVFAWALMSNHAHILLASGVMGLAKFVRRLLTVYRLRVG
jgi:putative transposase